MSPSDNRSRAERKEDTRRAILDSALRLSEESSLAGLSLRHVARDVGISSAAIYKHFSSADDIGLVLVEESYTTLRDVLRQVRNAAPTLATVMRSSVEVLLSSVRRDRSHFVFLSRERVGSSTRIRTAIRRELERFEAEIALEFARMPGAQRWSTSDLEMVARMIVSIMVGTCDRMLHATSVAQEDDIAEEAERQLRMVVVGAASWRSDPV